MIIVRNLHKSFGRLKVLEGVDLHIKKGIIFGLAGRSGAGKSTILRCFNGLEPFDKGRLIVDGVDIKQLSLKQLRIFRKDVGMVFQNFSLLERLSVYDNVALPLRCWKADARHLDKKVRTLLGLVGLSDKLKHRPRELSGGQKQRVAIARALSLDPKILLCDEATSALDPKTAREILSLLNRINRQLDLTIVMVTHQMSVLTTACSQVAILENGRLDAQGPVRQVFEQQPHALVNLLGEDAGNPGLQPGSVQIGLDCPPELILALTDELGTDVTLMSTQKEDGPRTRQIRIPAHKLDTVSAFLEARKIHWQVLSGSRFTGIN